jgi:hypothetical protein
MEMNCAISAGLNNTFPGDERIIQRNTAEVGQVGQNIKM